MNLINFLRKESLNPSSFRKVSCQLGCIALGCLLGSCASQYSVEGNASLPLLEGRMAYIRHMDGSGAIDSCEVVHGKFRMAGALDSVVCVDLVVGDDGFIPIVLEQGSIWIDISGSSVLMGGTPLNDRLYRFLSSRDSLSMLSAELPKRESEMYLEGYTQDEIIDRLAGEQMELARAMDKLETRFIEDNYDNVLGVTWFMQLCNHARNVFGYPTTTPQIDEIYSQAPESFRQNHEIREYMKLCEGE